MSAALDPYFDWLGIPPSEQPPNYYRLLGLPAFETDLTKIVRASQARIVQLSVYLAGPARLTAEQMLQVIGQAQVCLADANSKKIYDDYLRTLLPPAPATITPPTSTPPTRTPPTPQAAQNYPAAAKHSDAVALSGDTADAAPELDFLKGQQAAAPSSSGSSGPVGMSRRPPAGGGSAIGKLIAVLVPAAVTAGLAMYVVRNNINVSSWFDSSDSPKSGKSPTNVAAKQDPQKSTKGNGRANDATTSIGSSNPPKGGQGGTPGKSGRPNGASRSGTSNGFGGGLTGAAMDADPDFPDEPKGTSPNQTAPNSTKEHRPVRRRVPDESALAKSQKVIQEVYGKDISGAKSSPERIALGEKLFSQALESGSDAAAQFALLNAVRDLGHEATELPLVLRAVEALAAHFEVEGAEVKLDALTKFLDRKESLAGHYRPFIEAALQASAEAHVRDDLDRAIAFARLALSGATKINDSKLIQRITDRGKELVALRGLLNAANEGFEKIKTAPDDPNANLAIGKWISLVKRDFFKGIPYLTKGSDADLRSVAQLDEADPSDAVAQRALADRWWDLAQSTDAAWEKNAELRRAEYWYQKTIGSQTGLDKARDEKRIEEISKRLASEDDVKGAVVPLSFTGAFGRSVITSPIKLSPDELRRNIAGDVFEVLARDPKLKIERLDAWEFDESGNVQMTNFVVSGGFKKITDQTDTIARWDVGDNLINLNFTKAQLFGTVQFTARHEGIGVVKGNRGELVFTFQFKRVVPFAKCTGRFRDNKNPPVDLTLFTSGSIGRKIDSQHTWSVRGNQLSILDGSALDGTYTLSEEKALFSGRSRMGRDVDGKLAPLDPPK